MMNITKLSCRALMVAVGASMLSPFWAGNAAMAADAKVSAAAENLEEVIVTGSILRRTQAEITAPITVITSEQLDQRGITTVQDAIQSVASSNGPALTNSFTANGAFAGGASGVSLRGLSTNSTLVLFDGMRAAYYPLADDGVRNFVDLNTIQDDVVEKVDVLRDGASSSYGADAIAGVVNIITKRQFQGFSGRAEVGESGRSDAHNHRLSFMVGTGDLASQGFNIYLSGFYTASAPLKNSERPYPYNSDDQSGLCYQGNCGPDNRVFGLNNPGGLTATDTRGSTFYVRPYDATNTTPLGRYQFLNPATGCRPFSTSYTPNATELAASGSIPTTVCTEDRTNLYGYILPQLKRFGLTTRATARVFEDSEAYAQVNFLQSESQYGSFPASIRAAAPTGILFPAYTTASGPTILTLPVFVCAAGVNCDTAADSHLNPNNPFAAAGEVARLIGRLHESIPMDYTRNRAYRFAAGLKGKVFSDWDYDFGVTGMHTDLLHTMTGYVQIQHLLNVIAQGTYNFVDPTKNSQATQNYLAPQNDNLSTSDLYQAQITLGRKLMTLPGGPLRLGLGASFFNESVNAPSANPDSNGPTDRYFTINAFGTKGSRTVSAAFFELNAPFTKMLEGNVSGRYDRYSSGQNAFSPKVGLVFTPIRQLSVHGSYSRGFRIPSFAEANSLPTTGYVNSTATLFNDTYLSGYGCTVATFSTCPVYIRNSSYGLTSVATPTLKPEKSESYTLGVAFAPMDNLRFTVDYYNVVKTQAITTADCSGALSAYYSGQPILAPCVVTPDAPDVNNPTLQPVIQFVQTPFVNANKIRSAGFDFGATSDFRLGRVNWNSRLDVSYVSKLSTTFPDGTTNNYQGTLGNFNLTAGSGTPRWHGNWQNTFGIDKFSATLTLNYFGGYNLSAEDQTGPGTAGQCGLSSGFTPCNVASYTTFDLVGNMDVTSKISVYLDVVNLADKLPPVDPVTYGAINYNPVQGGEGIIGRAFRLGFKAKF